MRVNEIMDLNFTVVSEKTTTREAFTLMQKFGMDVFPILDRQAKLMGVVTREEILRTFFAGAEDLGEGTLPDLESLEEKGVQHWDIPVKDIMRVDYPYVTVYDPVMKVASFLLSQKLDTVPVVDIRKHVVGVVDRKLILEALMNKSFLGSEARPGRRYPVREEVAKKEPEKDFADFEKVERRRDSRVPTKLFAFCENAASKDQTPAYRYWPDARVRDLSVGGVQLEVNEPLQIGDIFHLKFNLTEPNSSVGCLARAVYQRKDGRTGLFRAGLMFLALTSSEREKIEEYVSKGGLNVVGKV